MNNPLVDLAIRFLINFIFLLIIARVLYYTNSKRKEYVFTIVVIGITVFVLCYMLSSINLELGLAIGLFAIFGILRYITLSIQIREMTYLFLAITISVINSLTAAVYESYIVLGVNIVILLITASMELYWFRRAPGVLSLKYEKIELIKPDRKKELIADLEARLGIEVLDCKIGSINFLRDTAVLEVEYDAKKYPDYLSEYQDS